MTIFLTQFYFSCSKKNKDVELIYSLEEFNKLAKNTTSFIHTKEDAGPDFSDYTFGVNRIDAKTLIFKRLVFFAIPFENTEQARADAKRLNQYYSRNWLFDRVEGEPVLEDYVIETFKATNPGRQIQRIPKTHKKPEGEHTKVEAVHH